MLPRLRKSPVTLLLCLTVAALACRPADDSEVIAVRLQGTQSYQLDLVGGDEEGARVVEQARHFEVSEIRRDASTNWYARYVYEPAAGFIGEDRVELEVLTGSDGASAPTRRRRVTVLLSIRD